MRERSADSERSEQLIGRRDLLSGQRGILIESPQAARLIELDKCTQKKMHVDERGVLELANGLILPGITGPIFQDQATPSDLSTLKKLGTSHSTFEITEG
jgi:hypothetical protein